jgi:hypothetical protein
MTLKQLMEASRILPPLIGLQPERVYLETTGPSFGFNRRIRRAHEADLKAFPLKAQAQMESRDN